MRQLVGPGLLAALVAVLMIATTAGVAPAARPEIGIARAGHTALEFVSHLEQAGLNFDSYGYLTHIAGLDDAQLFSDQNPLHRNETTARFTFRGMTQASQRFAVDAGPAGTPPPPSPSLLDVDSAGSETFFFSPTGDSRRSFGNPASFTTGTAVVMYAIHFQDEIAAFAGLAPADGVLSGNGELCQQSASDFSLDGQHVRIGRTGLFQRLDVHGWTMLTSATGPTSFANVGGTTLVFDSGDCVDPRDP